MAANALAIAAGVMLASPLIAQQDTTSRPAKPKDAAAEQARRDQVAKKTAVVRGRCIAAETKKPLAGCTVKFRAWGMNRAAVAAAGSPKWKKLDPVVTGADGRFEFRFEPSTAWQHGLGIGLHGRVPRTGRWTPFEPGQVDDLGDIRLHKGVYPHIKVVDENGETFQARSRLASTSCRCPWGPKAVDPGGG